MAFKLFHHQVCKGWPSAGRPSQRQGTGAALQSWMMRLWWFNEDLMGFRSLNSDAKVCWQNVVFLWFWALFLSGCNICRNHSSSTSKREWPATLIIQINRFWLLWVCLSHPKTPNIWIVLLGYLTPVPTMFIFIIIIIIILKSVGPSGHSMAPRPTCSKERLRSKGQLGEASHTSEKKTTKVSSYMRISWDLNQAM